MKRTILSVMFAGLLLVSCDSDNPRVPPATSTASPYVRDETPQPTSTPDASQCPVDAATCAMARGFLGAWEREDVDALMDMSRPIESPCPVPRPPGLGGPYPLCDSATVDGEVRAGYLWNSGTHGGLWDAASMRGLLIRLINSDLHLLTIGCRQPTPGTCERDFILVFGTEKSGVLDVVYDVPVFVDNGAGRIVGALPRFVSCTATTQSPCERVLGGTVDGPDYRFWVSDAGISRPLPGWEFVRWTP